ncbi:serine hydrolase domain-containing protein [Pseudoroseomonas globiformis]|uniref:Serine hydrolase domain-containing protein n=1 Tax=Teichococcus globiformis TaxID=2307229 RepID=A0ABV7G1K4_9PROT
MSLTLSSLEAHFPDGGEFLLLPPTAQATAYANVDRMFATRIIRRGTAASPLPRGPAIAPRYVSDGRERGVSDYFDRACVAGLLVIKSGQVVLERYGLGLTEATRWSSMSMVKSLTSTLVGAALRDGAIHCLDDAVSKYLPVMRGSAYDRVSVRHLITMSSGVAWSEDYVDRASHVNRYSRSLGAKVPGGVLALLRELSPEHEPGTVFRYNTGDTYLLGCLLSAATGETLADYMSRKIWVPCGMEQDAFYTLESDGGQEIGGSRAGMVLRDFGRFGLFILEGGVCPADAVLPDGWVEEAGRPAFRFAPNSNSYGATGYGYSWWLDPDGAMVAVGFAGQSLYINRAEDLVVVTLSCQPQPPYAAAYGIDFRAERQAFTRSVLAAAR